MRSVARRVLPVLVVLGAVVAYAPGARAGGADAAAGERIAHRWCVNCHVVDAKAKKGADAAPPLPALMQRPQMTAERLKVFLTEPHGGMKGMSFSRREIADLVAYIRSRAE
jgi:mono/diheme cytochrome c family protein